MGRGEVKIQGFVHIYVNKINYYKSKLRSKALSWVTPISISSMTCWSKQKGQSCRSKAAGSPWDRVTTRHPRGVQVRIQGVDGGAEARGTNQTNDSGQRAFASKDVWTIGNTVWHTGTHYSFHNEVFFFMFWFVCFLLGREAAGAEGRYRGMGRRMGVGMGCTMWNYSLRIDKLKTKGNYSSKWLQSQAWAFLPQGNE